MNSFRTYYERCFKRSHKERDSLAVLEQIGKRFQGVDLKFRRCIGSGWMGEWSAEVKTSKRDRDAYRLVAYGSTAESAIANLETALNRVDETI